MGRTARVLLAWGTPAASEVDDLQPVHDDSVALDVQPQRPSAPEQTSDLLVRRFQQFNLVAGEAMSLLQPPVDGHAPAVIVLVDGRWPDDDDVEIAIAVSLSSGERAEDDDTDGMRLDVAAALTELAQDRSASIGQSAHLACRDVLAHEPEQSGRRHVPALDDAQLDQRRQDP
jgi:hypothetical protein